jgi:N4-gp56 family major capsid protein
MKFLSILRNAFSIALGLGADVITVTSGTVGLAGNTAAELITFMSARLLEVAELNTITDQFGEKVPLPSNSSLTIRFVREEKLAVPATPTQLTQGVPPDSIGITTNQFEAIMEQYGIVVRISDLAELTARHNIIERTIYVLGLQAAEIYDQLIYNVLDAAVNQYRPNSKAGDVNLTQSDVPGYKDLTALDAALNSNGARPFEGGEYVFLTSPQPYASLLQDPDFKASHQFNQPEAIWNGEMGRLGGFRIVRSNAPAFAASSQATVGAANLVYSSFALGRFAYQISDLQNLRVYVIAPGGQSDPLQQNRKMGWKFAFKAIITNQTWIRRVRSAGANSVNN